LVQLLLVDVLLFDALYAIFARRRVQLGRLFGRRCVGDRCALSPTAAQGAHNIKEISGNLVPLPNWLFHFGSRIFCALASF